MTRQDFIDKHKHELAGVIADAAVVQRAGAPLAHFLRLAMQRIDQRLGSIYDDLQPAETKPQLRAVK